MNSVALLTWYRADARDLPWRRDPSPYAVLMSELMCQQTRVETALPYFERFMKRWPTIDHLARAEESDLVEAWAGLGYYSRARNLHRCAKKAVAMGGLPSTAAELRELPGIGAYTAGAIASIAFGRAEPAVDGNVQRVMARQLALETEPTSAIGKRAVTNAAAATHEALPAGAHPGDLNQALMELGARICVPRNPKCGSCPIDASCEAKARGEVSRFPVMKKRKPPVPAKGVAGILRGPQGVLLVRKPANEILGGLWTPPLVMEPEGGEEEALVEAFAQAGKRVHLGTKLGTVVHVFSHRKLTTSVYAVAVRGDCPVAPRWEAVKWSAKPEGVSTLAKKILATETVLPLLAADQG